VEEVEFDIIYKLMSATLPLPPTPSLYNRGNRNDESIRSLDADGCSVNAIY